MNSRFVFPMFLLLAALAWGTAELIEATSLRWSEEDRGALALLGATDAELAAAENAAHSRAAWLHRAVLALYAVQALLTLGALFAAKFFLWRRWTRRVQDLMNGHEPADRYAPVLRDLRDHVDRVVQEGVENEAPDAR